VCSYNSEHELEFFFVHFFLYLLWILLFYFQVFFFVPLFIILLLLIMVIYFQLSRCRKLLGKSFTSSVLKLEHKFIRSLIPRQHQGGFAFCIGWRLQVDAEVILYTRVIEYGTLTGVINKLFEKSSVRVVLDKILTQSDIARLRTTFSKPRADDWKLARADFDSFVATLNHNSHFATIIFADSKSTGLHSTIGQEWCGVDMDLIPSHIMQPCATLAIDPFAAISLQTPMTFDEQLSVLNQVPSQCIISTKENVNNDLPLYLAWPCFAPKHTILTQAHNIDAIASSLEFTLSNSRHSRVKSRSTLKKRKRCNPSHLAILSHQTRLTKAARVLMSDDISIVSARSFVANLQPYQQYQNMMVQVGHIRICKNSDTEVRVVWNKFDSINSE